MKKINLLCSLFLMLCTTTSFANRGKGLQVNDAEFIYIVAYPGTQNNSTTSYVSTIIEYGGYEACTENSSSPASKEQLYSEAGRKFLKHLQSEYGINQNEWKVQYKGRLSFSDYPSGYFNGYESKAEAQGDLEVYLRNNDRIERTNFTYKCLTNNVSNKTTSQATNSVGKAYWCTYYVKNDNTVYITNVYNNDCNHCQNEIAVAFEKWLILNDYDHQASTLHIISLQDVDASSLEERRTEIILRYKQKNYAVSPVVFTYKEN